MATASDKGKDKENKAVTDSTSGLVPEKKPRKPRTPSAPKLTAADYKEFSEMNEQLIAQEKAKGAEADDSKLERWFGRRKVLQALSGPTS